MSESPLYKKTRLLVFLVCNNFLPSRWISVRRNGRKLPLFRSYDSAQYTYVYLPTLFLLSLPEELVDQIFEKIRLSKRFVNLFFIRLLQVLPLPLIFSFWHIGAFYEAAIRDKTIHMAEHLSMYFSSIAMWWPVCGPSKRIPQCDSVRRCFTFLPLMLGQTPSFAFLTFSKDVLYDTYFYAERIINLSPSEDQKTGGVLMKLANMAVSVGVLSSIFTAGQNSLRLKLPKA